MDFRKLIYYDKALVDDFRTMVKGKRETTITSSSSTIVKRAGIGINPISAEASESKTVTETRKESLLFECDEFVSFLAPFSSEDFFDFTVSEEYDITSVPQYKIIKVDSTICIPEGFDIMQLLDSLKPFLMDSIDESTSGKSEKEAIRFFFDSATSKSIPAVFETENILLCTKLMKDNLIIDYEDLADIEDEVTILARLSSMVKQPDKPFYDPLKDFIKVNRVMRRQIERDKNLLPITVESKYRTIDVLAIYK